MRFYSETTDVGAVCLRDDTDDTVVMWSLGDYLRVSPEYVPLVRQLLIGVLTQDEDTVEAMVPLIEAWDEEDAAQLARALLAVIVEEATPVTGLHIQRVYQIRRAEDAVSRGPRSKALTEAGDSDD